MKIYEKTAARTENGITAEDLTYRGEFVRNEGEETFYFCPHAKKPKSIKRATAREFKSTEDVFNYQQKTELK